MYIEKNYSQYGLLGNLMFLAAVKMTRLHIKGRKDLPKFGRPVRALNACRSEGRRCDRASRGLWREGAFSVDTAFQTSLADTLSQSTPPWPSGIPHIANAIVG